jgi:hypothetical protein
VIQQNRNIVAFVDVIAHTAKLPKTKQRRKRRGIYPKGLNNQNEIYCYFSRLVKVGLLLEGDFFRA